MDSAFTSYSVTDRSYVSFVKRAIHLEVLHKRFTSQQKGEIDIIVSEITSNLVKHAGGGELLYRISNEGEEDSVFEILAVDKGPGMADTTRMLKDGISTKNTLGQGLGAIHRLSNLAQVYSIPGWGTVLYAKVHTRKERYEKSRDLELEVRSLCINKPRELVCGDGFRIKRTETGAFIFFGDGLGHGEHAKFAVDSAGDFFMKTELEDPVEILRGIHESIRRTRGLVGVVAHCDLKNKQWRICGAGNILVRLYQGITYRSYMSYNGTVGLNIPNSIKVSEYPLEKNQYIIMCSDGIRTRWDITKYASIQRLDPLLLAASIYKDFTRGNDDSSVLIAKVV